MAKTSNKPNTNSNPTPLQYTGPGQIIHPATDFDLMETPMGDNVEQDHAQGDR